MDTLHRLDDRLLTDVNDLARHTGWLRGAVLAYAGYGVVLFAALLLAGVLLRRAATDPAPAAAGGAPLAVLLALGRTQPLVSAFAEARPYTTHQGLLVLAGRSRDFSFPSDHAVMAGAGPAGLWQGPRALGALATFAALVMAFSRVYIAAHYPWDVAVGLIFGTLVALLGWVLLRTPLTLPPGWLPPRPGLPQAFPAPVALPDTREPTAPAAA